MSVPMSQLLSTGTVTWIKVEKSSLNFFGVIAVSLEIVVICAALALVLGGVFGAIIIRWRRPISWAHESFRLLHTRS